MSIKLKISYSEFINYMKIAYIAGTQNKSLDLLDLAKQIFENNVEHGTNIELKYDPKKNGSTKISGVKEIRYATGCGLKEAVDLWETGDLTAYSHHPTIVAHFRNYAK